MQDTPKEQQSAYQRWEMASFGDERPSVVAQRPPPEVKVVLEGPTEAELAAIREEARLIGYEEGHAAGHRDALALGKIENAREVEHLRQLTATFGDAVAEADQLIAQDVLELALHLAKGMLKNALAVKPELLLPIVREAVDYLPSLQQPALLILNPADAELVREGMSDELNKGGWRLIEDAQVARGGCKVDTASNQIDSQVSTRWQRLTNALGTNVDWLGP